MTNVKVKGMHCPSCEMLIKESMEDEGAKNVKIDHKTGNLSFESIEKAIEIVKKEGYEVVEWKETLLLKELHVKAALKL